MWLRRYCPKPWVLVLALALLGLALLTGFSSRVWQAGKQPGSDEAIVPQQVFLQLEQTPGWRPVSLPDAWVTQRPQQQGFAWYRLRFVLPAPMERPALYIPRWSMQGAVWWDGHLVDAPASWGSDAPRQLNRPQLFRLDEALVQPGEHEVLVQIRAWRGLQPGVSQVFLGEQAQLAPYYRALMFWQAESQVAIGIAVFLLALLVIGFSHVLRDAAFAYAGLSMLLWGFSVFGWGSETAWFGGERWEMFYYLSRLTFPYLIGMFLYHFFRMPWRWIPPVMLAAWCGVTLPTVWGWPDFFADSSALVFGATGVFFLTLLLLTIARGVRLGDTQSVLVAGVLVFAHSAGLHDLAWWAGKSDYAEPMLNQFGGVVLFTTLIIVVLQRYLQIQRELHGLNSDLERRVLHRTSEALRLQEETQRLQQARALQEERERIFRDLHDDVGAKLLTLAIRADDPEHSEIARAALSDMRLMISRTSQGPAPLAFLLADLRGEAASRLQEAGLRLHWKAPDLPFDAPGPVLSPTAALDVGRVLREALSNVLKHAQAAQVHVEVELTGQALRFAVHDDGRGLPNAAVHAEGNGRRNMQSRVQRWGGGIQWRSGPTEGLPVFNGCRVHWEFPLLRLLHGGAAPASP